MAEDEETCAGDTFPLLGVDEVAARDPVVGAGAEEAELDSAAFRLASLRAAISFKRD